MLQTCSFFLSSCWNFSIHFIFLFVFISYHIVSCKCELYNTGSIPHFLFFFFYVGWRSFLLLLLRPFQNVYGIFFNVSSHIVFSFSLALFLLCFLIVINYPVRQHNIVIIICHLQGDGLKDFSIQRYHSGIYLKNEIHEKWKNQIEWVNKFAFSTFGRQYITGVSSLFLRTFLVNFDRAHNTKCSF